MDQKIRPWCCVSRYRFYIWNKAIVESREYKGFVSNYTGLPEVDQILSGRYGVLEWHNYEMETEKNPCRRSFYSINIKYVSTLLLVYIKWKRNI